VRFEFSKKEMLASQRAIWVYTNAVDEVIELIDSDESSMFVTLSPKFEELKRLHLKMKPAPIPARPKAKKKRKEPSKAMKRVQKLYKCEQQIARLPEQSRRPPSNPMFVRNEDSTPRRPPNEARTSELSRNIPHNEFTSDLM